MYKILIHRRVIKFLEKMADEELKKKEKKAIIKLVPDTNNKKWVSYSGSGSLAPSSNKTKGNCQGFVSLTMEVDYDGSGVLSGHAVVSSLNNLSMRYSSGGVADITVDYFYILPNN